MFTGAINSLQNCSVFWRILLVSITCPFYLACSVSALTINASESTLRPGLPCGRSFHLKNHPMTSTSVFNFLLCRLSRSMNSFVQKSYFIALFELLSLFERRLPTWGSFRDCGMQHCHKHTIVLMLIYDVICHWATVCIHCVASQKISMYFHPLTQRPYNCFVACSLLTCRSR